MVLWGLVERLIYYARHRWCNQRNDVRHHIIMCLYAISSRPCVVIVCFAGLGVLFARLYNTAFDIVLTFIFLGIIVYLAYCIFRLPNIDTHKRRGMLLVCLSVFMYFFSFIVLEQSGADRIRQNMNSFDESSMYRGKVVKVNYSVMDRQTNCYTVRFDEGIRILLYTRETLIHGDRIMIRTNVQEHDTLRNPGGFDARKYYESQGIFFRVFATPDQIVIIENASYPYRIYDKARDGVHRFKLFFYTQWSGWIGQENASVFTAMILGEKGWMSDSLKAQFRDGHMSHLTAVSGLHIQSFLIPLLCIQQCFRPGRVWGRICILIFLWALAFVVDFSPSVTRAVIMYMMFLLSGLIGKRNDTINTLFLSALIIIFINPYALSSRGFQLSFLATAGILALSPKIKESLDKTGMGKIASERLSSFLAVQIAIIPLMYFMSTKYSLPLAFMAILASFPAQLICVLSLPISVICFAFRFHPTFELLNSHLASPVRYLIELTIYIARLGGRLSLDAYNISNINYLIIIAGLGLCGVLLFKKCALKKFGVIFLCIIMSIGMINQGLAERKKPLATIIFADVGQGDCAVILTQNHCLVVDGGDYGYGEKVLIPLLNYYAVDSPNITLLTHLHADHYGGLTEMMNSGRVDQIGTPYIADPMSDFGFINDTSNAFFPILRGDNIQFCDNVMISVWSPEVPRYEGENEDSLVFLLEAGMTTVLFTGDAGFSTEDELLRTYFSSDTSDSSNVQVDILKVGHHGSRFSTSAHFLDELSVDTAVISVGANYYGHPDTGVLERLSDAHINTYRTDLCGAIIIEIYSDYYTVNPMIEWEE